MWKKMIEGPWEISDAGELRLSCNRSNLKKGCILKPTIRNTGYVGNVLQLKRRKRMYSRHTLVARYFIGPLPKGLEINHKDGDKTNNNVSNLEYISHQENITHAHSLGLFLQNRKLTPEQALEIYQQRGLTSQMQLASKFKVGRSTIRQIHSGISFADITGHRKYQLAVLF